MTILTKDDINLIFKDFLDRLQQLGNDREAMFQHHLARLVNQDVDFCLKHMPRGPRGHWHNMMADIREDIKSRR